MALPATIGAGLSWSDCLAARHGPFENGSNLYAVLLDKTNNHLEVWKSADGGDTWAEQDSANHKGINTTAGAKTCQVIQSGTTLYICYLPTGLNVGVVTFDLSTDAWGTAPSATSSVPQTGIVSGVRPFFAARRSDGDVIVLHQGVTEGIMGTQYRRVVYDRNEGGTWTSGTDVGGTGAQVHHDARAAILGSSDRVHLFWTDTTNSDLKHRSLTSANVLGTIQDIDATANVGNYSAGLPALNGSEVVLPYVDSTGDLNVARATSADTPTWSITGVVTTTNDPETTNANPGAVAVDGTTVHLFWPDDTTQDIYRDNDAGTGTWGTDTEWTDAVTCNGISIGKITNAIGVLYDDGGTVKYDKYSLAVAGPQTITLTAKIATAEAFFGPKLNLQVRPTAPVGTAEAFFGPKLNLQVRPSALASAEAFFGPTLAPGGVTITPGAAIVSAEAFFAPKVNLRLLAGTIGTAEQFFAPTLNLRLLAGTTASAEVVFAPSILVDQFLVLGAKIASGEAFNQPALAFGATVLQPSLIGSGEAVFGPRLNLTINPGALGSAEAFFNPTLAPGAVAVSLTAKVASAEAFFNPAVSVGALSIVLGAKVASAEAFFGPTLSPGAVSIAPGAKIPSGEAVFGPTLRLFLLPAAIGSAEAFAQPRLNLTLRPPVIGSAESVFGPKLNLQVRPGALGTAEQVFGPSLSQGAFFIQPGARIATAEAFFSPSLLPGAVSIAPSTIATGELVYAPALRRYVSPAAIGTAEAFFGPRLNLRLFPGALPSSEQVYGPTMRLYLLPAAIVSGQAFFAPALAVVAYVRPSLLGSGEAFPQPTVLPGAVVLLPVVIATGEAFPLPLVFVGVLVVPTGVTVSDAAWGGASSSDARHAASAGADAGHGGVAVLDRPGG